MQPNHVRLRFSLPEVEESDLSDWQPNIPRGVLLVSLASILFHKSVLLCTDDTVHIRSRRSARPLVWFRMHDVHWDEWVRHRPDITDRVHGRSDRRSAQVESQVARNVTEAKHRVLMNWLETTEPASYQLQQ